MRSPRTGQAGPDPRGAQGFTLIEVMMAMGIMSFGLFAVIGLQVMAVRGNAYARERTEAKDLLDSVVDDVRTRSMQWVHLTQGAAPASFDVAYGGTLALSTAPSPGATIPSSELHSLPFLHGVAIAASTALDGAFRLNVHGEPGAMGDGTLIDASIQRAIYRVYYYAYQMTHPSDQNAALPLVRMTVFVTWDNKAYGEQGHDFDGNEEAQFFDRHVISASFYVALDRLW